LPLVAILRRRILPSRSLGGLTRGTGVALTSWLWTGKRKKPRTWLESNPPFQSPFLLSSLLLTFFRKHQHLYETLNQYSVSMSRHHSTAGGGSRARDATGLQKTHEEVKQDCTFRASSLNMLCKLTPGVLITTEIVPQHRLVSPNCKVMNLLRCLASSRTVTPSPKLVSTPFLVVLSPTFSPLYSVPLSSPFYFAPSLLYQSCNTFSTSNFVFWLQVLAIVLSSSRLRTASSRRG